MKNAEYQGNLSCPQRDSAEHEGYAGAQSVGSQEVKEQGGADLLERILSRDNLNRAYNRVKANKGAPGIDGMTTPPCRWARGIQRVKKPRRVCRLSGKKIKAFFAEACT